MFDDVLKENNGDTSAWNVWRKINDVYKLRQQLEQKAQSIALGLK